MVEDLDEIYKGCATSIKGVEYLKPKEYIEPFVLKLAPYKPYYYCNVKMADQLSIGETVNTVYNKVLITAIFPDSYSIKIKVGEEELKYRRVVCMAYALDVRTPMCKFYTGVVDDDLNFYAFGANCISLQQVEAGFPLDYSLVDKVVTAGLADNCLDMLQQFSTITIKKDDMQDTLGYWVDFAIKKEYVNDAGKVKLSPNMAIEAYKNIILDKESYYYCKGKESDMHHLYKAWVSQITSDEKEFMNRYEKTQLINNALKL